MDNDPDQKQSIQSKQGRDACTPSIAAFFLIGLIGAALGGVLTCALFFLIANWMESPRQIGGPHGVIDPVMWLAAVLFPGVVAIGAILGAMVAVGCVGFARRIGNKESGDAHHHAP
jgi:hypothetical protein